MGMITPHLAAKAAKQFVEQVLNALPQSLIDRLIAWKTAYPNTPLKYLPLPVRAEVKHILTNVLASTMSNPPTRPQPVVSLPVPTNGHTSAHPAPAPLRPAPARTIAQLTTVIGTDVKTGRDIAITATQQGVYILGGNGTGKTNVVKGMAAADAQAGRGFCVVEPHGQLVEEILGAIPRYRLNDVIYLDI